MSFPTAITCTTPPMRDAATAMDVHIAPNNRPERENSQPSSRLLWVVPWISSCPKFLIQRKISVKTFFHLITTILKDSLGYFSHNNMLFPGQVEWVRIQFLVLLKKWRKTWCYLKTKWMCGKRTDLDKGRLIIKTNSNFTTYQQ